MPEEVLDEYVWPSTLSAAVVAAAVLPIGTMSTVDLYRYIGHLADNEQAAQRQQIQFWKRALYPFACLVMIGLALPFAYLSARGGGISLKVFGGIMLGISFVLLNNVAGHLGLLRNWTPWIVAVGAECPLHADVVRRLQLAGAIPVKRGLLLFAHGARDPRWARAVRGGRGACPQRGFRRPRSPSPSSNS